MAEAFTTLGQSTLNGAISSTSATSFPVSSGSSFPSTGTFRGRVDNEIIKFSANSGNVLTAATRGDGGTTAATHLTGAVITLVHTAESVYAHQSDTLGLAVQASLPGGRLTLTTGTPYTTGDVSGASSVFYTPTTSNIVALWDGSYWQRITFSELTLAVGTVTAGLPYDVFLYSSGGSAAIEKLAWTNVGVRATGISIQDGRYCKTGDKTRLYVGSFVASSTSTTEDSEAKPYIYNHYHQRQRLSIGSGTDANDLSTTSAVFATISASLNHAVFVGVAQEVRFTTRVIIANSVFAAMDVGIGLLVNGITDYTMGLAPIDTTDYSNPIVMSRNIALPAGLSTVLLRWRMLGGGASVTYKGATRGSISGAYGTVIMADILR